MNTEQNYVGGGSYATSNEQTANNAGQTAKNQAETIQAYQPLNPKAQLLEVVSTFFADRDVTDVVEAINDLTRDWLKQVFNFEQDADRATFSKDYVANVLFTMNKVTEFIVKLQQSSNQILLGDRGDLNSQHDDAIKAYEEQICLSNQNAETREQATKTLVEHITLLSTEQ